MGVKPHALPPVGHAHLSHAVTRSCASIDTRPHHPNPGHAHAHAPRRAEHDRARARSQVHGARPQGDHRGWRLRRLRQPVQPRRHERRHGPARRLSRQPGAPRPDRHQAAVPAQAGRAHRHLAASRRGCPRPLRPRPSDARHRPRPRDPLAHARRRRSTACRSASAPSRRGATASAACAAWKRSICGKSPSSPSRCCPRRASPSSSSSRPAADRERATRCWQPSCWRPSRRLLRSTPTHSPAKGTLVSHPCHRNTRGHRLETKGASDLGFAIDDFMRAFEAFKDTNDRASTSIERRQSADVLTTEKLARIDRALDDNKRIVDELALKSARPHLGGHRAALRRRSAAQGRLRRPTCARATPSRLRDLEAKALSVGSDPDGGYLVPDELERTVNRAVRNVSPIRAIAGIRQVSGSVYKKPFAITGAETGWVAETAARPETDAPTLGRALLPDHGALRHAGGHLRAARRQRRQHRRVDRRGGARRLRRAGRHRLRHRQRHRQAEGLPRLHQGRATPPGAGATSASSPPAPTAPSPPPTPATS